jgi:hypothetical protein
MLYRFITIKVVVLEVLSEHHDFLCGQQLALCGFPQNFHLCYCDPGFTLFM